MAERPRSRQTIVVGTLTVVAMVAIATIFMLIASPWNDHHPLFHHKKKHHHATTQQF